MALLSPSKLSAPSPQLQASPAEFPDHKDTTPPGSPHNNNNNAGSRLTGGIYYPLLPPWQLALLTQQAFHARGKEFQYSRK